MSFDLLGYWKGVLSSAFSVLSTNTQLLTAKWLNLHYQESILTMRETKHKRFSLMNRNNSHMELKPRKLESIINIKLKYQWWTETQTIGIDINQKPKQSVMNRKPFAKTKQFMNTYKLWVCCSPTLKSLKSVF